MACSLGASDLEQRLANIAELGANSLISHDVDGAQQLLRFRAGAETRRRLEDVIAAEGQCCAFFDMALSEEDNALILAIAAPEEASEIAAALAKAFTAAA